MNILSDEIYGYWYNSNDPDGKSSKSWARAYYIKREFTRIQKCPWCGIRKTPKKFGGSGGALCMGCNNKYSALLKRCSKYIQVTLNNKWDCAEAKSIRKMLSILEHIDNMQSIYNQMVDDFLEYTNIHQSDIECYDLLSVFRKKIPSFLGRRSLWGHVSGLFRLEKPRNIYPKNLLRKQYNG